MTAGVVQMMTAGVVQMMTAGVVHAAAVMVHVASLAPPGSDNPRRTCSPRHQLMAAVMFHVTNLTPGSECNPR
jgi:hypothetical protein